MRRPLWCVSASSSVVHEAITTRRNGERKAQDERDDVQEGEEAGNLNAKKARMTPSLLHYDRLMQDCLGPAHGMHTVMKPDLGGWRYSSNGGLPSVN
jgi:hypothetical protein